MLPVGHMDFYPNGGSNQPGCPRQSFMNIITEEYEDGTFSKNTVLFFQGFSTKVFFLNLILLQLFPWNRWTMFSYCFIVISTSIIDINMKNNNSYHDMSYFMLFNFSETGNIISCSHSRSVLLFTESINTPCPFASYQCSRTRDFLAGNCFDCGGLPCPTIGYNAIKYRARGKFYLATRSSVPFCGNVFLFRWSEYY
jgi:hypothetical protein